MSYDFFIYKLSKAIAILDEMGPEICLDFDQAEVDSGLRRWRGNVHWREPDWAQVRSESEAFDFRLSRQWVIANGGPSNREKLTDLCRNSGWTLVDQDATLVFTPKRQSPDAG